MMRLRDAALVLSNATMAGNADAVFTRVHSDTRSLQAGDLFVALQGERFDAHAFLPQAAQAGAAAALVAPSARLPSHLPALIVPYPKYALGELAAAWRARFQLPLVLVTGSNGKTTTKEMIAAIFRAAVGDVAVLATQGNLNNDIGLPLTLLKLTGQHRLAVIEAGMNHPGETAQLAAIAQPTMVLITNAQREHQEFMQSVQAVADEHALAIHALPPDGTAVFPAADAYSAVWRAAAGQRRTIEYDVKGNDAISMRVLSKNALENRINIASNSIEHTVTLQIGGAHNIHNAAAAIAVAQLAGIDAAAIARGLNHVMPAKGRMRHVPGMGFTLVDDTYNANPDSVRAAIDALASWPGRRVLVLGDMGEVGTQGPVFHQEVGAYAAQQGVNALITLGTATLASNAAFGAAASHTYAKHTGTPQEAAQAVQALHLQDGDAVLVKGSRSMAMERVIEQLQQHNNKEAAAC
jgi:UDP-N-acetylmuramoyl-tripeptide--D-alanyl-D-alanine ligase